MAEASSMHGGVMCNGWLKYSNSNVSQYKKYLSQPAQ